MIYSIQMTSTIGLYPKTKMYEKQIIAMEHTGMEKTKGDIVMDYKISCRIVKLLKCQG